MNAASAGELAQSLLQDGSRLLLMIAMALFLAYLLFLLCTVAISSAITTWHALRDPARFTGGAGAHPGSPDERRGNRPARAGKHAVSA